ncbi:unnamed protein product, partial [Chrysoparadoxa australica]
RSWKAGTAALCPVLFLFPTGIHFVQSKEWSVPVVVAMLVVLKALSNIVFTGIALGTNHSAGASMRGTMNGISMTVGSVAKAMGPSIGSSVFAYSIANKPSVLVDYHLAFYMLASMLAVCSVCSFKWLPIQIKASPDT